MLRLSSALLIVALCCALTLAVIYYNTAPRIEEQKKILLERSLNSVLSADRYEKYENGMVYFEAYDKEGIVVGWCLSLSGKGYGGDINLLVGLDINEKITGIKVLEHKETPGLGSQISEVKYKQSESAFLSEFKGKTAEDIVLIKGKTKDNIQAITGATISSRAVVDAARQGVEAFLKIKK
ncbi:MAG: RnfABCDGE type electron transport complex subunit G [Candidatus Omnitrophica bacterium]|nr:RnfABCDGE type electron transport complex subunit G [Candidatus Omnitrophota bacterium]